MNAPAVRLQLVGADDATLVGLIPARPLAAPLSQLGVDGGQHLGAHGPDLGTAHLDEGVGIRELLHDAADEVVDDGLRVVVVGVALAGVAAAVVAVGTARAQEGQALVVVRAPAAGDVHRHGPAADGAAAEAGELAGALGLRVPVAHFLVHGAESGPVALLEHGLVRAAGVRVAVGRVAPVVAVLQRAPDGDAVPGPAVQAHAVGVEARRYPLPPQALQAPVAHAAQPLDLLGHLLQGFPPAHPAVAEGRPVGVGGQPALEHAPAHRAAHPVAELFDLVLGPEPVEGLEEFVDGTDVELIGRHRLARAGDGVDLDAVLAEDHRQLLLELLRSEQPVGVAHDDQVHLAGAHDLEDLAELGALGEQVLEQCEVPAPAGDDDLAHDDPAAAGAQLAGVGELLGDRVFVVGSLLWRADAGDDEDAEAVIGHRACGVAGA